MKAVEDTFSSSGFRQVVLPGVVLAAGAHPLLRLILPFVHEMYGIDANVLIVIEVLIFGLIISSGKQWIYYLYEGFRASWLTRWARSRANDRLTDLQNRLATVRGGRRMAELSDDERNSVYKIYEELQDFPLVRKGDKAERYVDGPTKLANVIATYEQYSKSRYGIDGIQFWHHLLSLAPSEARKEFAEKYEFAESLLLTSFSGIVVALLHFVLLVLGLIGRLNIRQVRVSGPETILVAIVFCGAGLVVWICFYKAAVFAHREMSGQMRSMIDLAFPAFVEWTLKMKVARETDDPELRNRIGRWLKDLRD